MKYVLKINSNYSKYIKTLKVSIIIIILILVQLFVVLFHGNDMTFKQMMDQGVPTTTFYVRHMKGYNLPLNFIEYASSDSIIEEFDIKEIRESQVLMTQNMNENMYILKAEDSTYKDVEGKGLEALSNNEVAVSSYYAHINFGSIENAIGKTVKIPITYIVTENSHNPLLAEQLSEKDEIELEVASVYKHSGLEKRYLNYLSKEDNLVDSGEIMYTDQSFVSNETFEKLVKTYIEDIEDSYNFYTGYQFVFNEYNKEIEQILEGQLRLRVMNYDTTYINAESTYDLFRNSENINNTMKLINGFLFVFLWILLISTLIYLIYLQDRYTSPFFNTLYNIGYKNSKQRIAVFIHEGYIAFTGLSIWTILNILITAIFGYRIIYLQDLYQFNFQIFKYCAPVSLGIYLFTLFLNFTFKGWQNKNKTTKVKLNKEMKKIDDKFYMRRFFKLYSKKYVILLIIISISASGFFSASNMMNALVEIYINANVLKYDISARMTGQVFKDIHEYVDSYAIVSAESNNFFIHKYDNEKTAASYKGSVVWLYGDAEKFLSPPEIGDYPNFKNNPTFEDFIEKYPYFLELGDRFSQHYEENKHSPFEFRIWMTQSIASRLNADVNSFIESFIKGGFMNTAIYPVAGITNIFSNNGDTIYILPSPAKSSIFTDAILNKRYENNFFDVIINLEKVEDKEMVIDILEKHELENKVYDIKANDSKKNTVGVLNTRINRFIIFFTFIIYVLLLISIYISKKEDDRLSQEANIKAYYNLGIDPRVILDRMRNLNILIISTGVVIGFLTSLVLRSSLTDMVYTLMEVIR